MIGRRNILDIKKQAHHLVDATHTLEISLYQVMKTNLGQKVFLPAFHGAIHANGDIPLFASHTTVASLFITSGDVRQGIGQIVKFAAIEELLGHVIFQPHNLRDLHLNGHLPPNISQ